MAPEIQAVFIPMVVAVVMGVFGLYVKDMVISSIKKHLTEALPGLFAIEFQKYRDKTDALYANHDVVEKMEGRLKAMELWRAGG